MLSEPINSEKSDPPYCTVPMVVIVYIVGDCEVEIVFLFNEHPCTGGIT